jgi:hypothetical protein
VELVLAELENNEGLDARVLPVSRVAGDVDPHLHIDVLLLL